MRGWEYCSLLYSNVVTRAAPCAITSASYLTLAIKSITCCSKFAEVLPRHDAADNGNLSSFEAVQLTFGQRIVNQSIDIPIVGAWL
jgi:hypothetical protein